MVTKGSPAGLQQLRQLRFHPLPQPAAELGTAQAAGRGQLAVPNAPGEQRTHLGKPYGFQRENHGLSWFIVAKSDELVLRNGYVMLEMVVNVVHCG